MQPALSPRDSVDLSGIVVGAPFQGSQSQGAVPDNMWRGAASLISSLEARVEVTLFLPEGTDIVERVPLLCTLDQLRDLLQRSALAAGTPLPQPFGLKVAFTDHYFTGGEMLRPLKEVPYVTFCTRHGLPIRLVAVAVEQQTREQRHLMTVQRLLGRPFPWSFDDLEGFAFRSHFYQQLSAREPPPVSCAARTSASFMAWHTMGSR